MRRANAPGTTRAEFNNWPKQPFEDMDSSLCVSMHIQQLLRNPSDVEALLKVEDQWMSTIFFFFFFIFFYLVAKKHGCSCLAIRALARNSDAIESFDGVFGAFVLDFNLSGNGK
jgi:hypothetical protein